MRVLRSVTLHRSPVHQHLEGRDRLARLGDHGFLAGDQPEIGRRASTFLRSFTASPMPMLMTIFCSFGTSILFL